MAVFSAYESKIIQGIYESDQNEKDAQPFYINNLEGIILDPGKRYWFYLISNYDARITFPFTWNGKVSIYVADGIRLFNS